jgi:glycosyltransferase involved in cell wall biosynthesis
VKILFISSLYYPNVVGGAERVLQAQAEALQRAGHDVMVLCTVPESGLQTDLVNGVVVWRSGLKNLYFPHDPRRTSPPAVLAKQFWHLLDVYNVSMASVVRKAVKSFGPEVASVHNLPGWSVAVWDALHSLGVPIVQVLHDQYLLCPTTTMFRDGELCATQCAKCRVLRLPHRSKSKKVDTVVGVSRFISEKMKQFGYFEGVRKMHTIHNVRDMSGLQLPVTPRTPDGLTTFGFIGRLVPSKGIEFLLETFTRTAREDWRLLVAGTAEPQYELSLKERFKDSRISFLGQISAEDFFSKIDCTVIPSLWEDTFPSVAFESLLFGRPIIGCRIGGIPELVNDDNGRLFRAGDTSELAETLVWASDQRSVLNASFSRIQGNAKKYADMDAWVNTWSEVYAEAAFGRKFAEASELVRLT